VIHNRCVYSVTQFLQCIVRMSEDVRMTILLLCITSAVVYQWCTVDILNNESISLNTVIFAIITTLCLSAVFIFAEIKEQRNIPRTAVNTSIVRRVSFDVNTK